METVKESTDGVGGKEISQTGQSKSNLLNAEKTDNLLLSQLGGTSDSWLRQIVPMRENATTMSVIGKLTSCSVMSLGVMYLVWNSKRIIKQSSRRRRFGKKVVLSFICVGLTYSVVCRWFEVGLYSPRVFTEEETKDSQTKSMFDWIESVGTRTDIQWPFSKPVVGDRSDISHDSQSNSDSNNSQGSKSSK